jgi:hypothetical protein
MWEKLLKLFMFRTEARASGLSSKDANKAAATAVALEELAKKAEQESAKKQEQK